MSENTTGFAANLPWLSLVAVLILVGLFFTAYLMRKSRKREYGHVKGVAVDPDKVLRDNTPRQ